MWGNSLNERLAIHRIAWLPSLAFNNPTPAAPCCCRPPLYAAHTLARFQQSPPCCCRLTLMLHTLIMLPPLLPPAVVLHRLRRPLIRCQPCFNGFAFKAS